MRFLAVIAVALLVSAGCASGPPDPWEHWGRNEPVMVIMHLPLEVVGPVCVLVGARPPPPGAIIMACAELGPKKEPCQIIMPYDIPHFEYLAILEHEMAHCRGWEHGDPQPRGTV